MQPADRAQLIGIGILIVLVLAAMVSLSGPHPRTAWLERLTRRPYGPRQRIQIAGLCLGAVVLTGLLVLAALLS